MRTPAFALAVSSVIVSFPALAQLKPASPAPTTASATPLPSAQFAPPDIPARVRSQPQPLSMDEKLKRYAQLLKLTKAPPVSFLDMPMKVTPRMPVSITARLSFGVANVWPFANPFAGLNHPDGLAVLKWRPIRDDSGTVYVKWQASPNRNYLLDCEIELHDSARVSYYQDGQKTTSPTGGHVVLAFQGCGAASCSAPENTRGTAFSPSDQGYLSFTSCEVTPVKTN